MAHITEAEGLRALERARVTREADIAALDARDNWNNDPVPGWETPCVVIGEADDKDR